jgi:hypothetical protein
MIKIKMSRELPIFERERKISMKYYYSDFYLEIWKKAF